MRRWSGYFAYPLAVLTVLVFASCSNWLGGLRPESRNVPEGPEVDMGKYSEDLGRDEGEAQPPARNPAKVMEPQRRFKNGNRATRDDFIDQSQEEGSLWASSGQTNYYFTKNKIRSPGDIVTITLEEGLYKDLTAELKRALDFQEQAQEVADLREQIKTKLMTQAGLMPIPNKDQLVTSSAAAQGAPGATANTPGAAATAAPQPAASAGPAVQTSTLTMDDIEKSVEKIGFADVNILPFLEVKTGETLMAEIVERYPNGNYKIRAIKKVDYKKGAPRWARITGVVKAADIAEETDIVNSGKLYAVQIETAR